MEQCAIPVFDGLLPEPHNSRLLDLLFITAHWHGLAKLRIHTNTTLDILDRITTILGQTLRDFLKTTCQEFKTRELPREASARERRKTKGDKKSKAAPETPVLPISKPSDLWHVQPIFLTIAQLSPLSLKWMIPT